MIFCSVGTQAPFERMLGYLHEWSHANPQVPIVAQVGNNENDLGRITAYKTIAEPLFSKNFNASKVIVSHAGMGNIIRSLNWANRLLLSRATVGAVNTSIITSTTPPKTFQTFPLCLSPMIKMRSFRRLIRRLTTAVPKVHWTLPKGTA